MKRQEDAGDFEPSVQVPGPLFALPRAAEPFDRSKLDPTSMEIMVGVLIWEHQGRENPISIARLVQKTGVGERTIKGIVADLIAVHRMRIGARREEPAGYFIIRDAEDIPAGTGAYKAQFLAMALRLRVLDPGGMADLYGQLPLEAGQ
jgi:hypothetical protein